MNEITLNVKLTIENLPEVLSALSEFTTTPTVNKSKQHALQEIVQESPEVSPEEIKSLLLKVIDIDFGEKAKSILAAYGAERISDLSSEGRAECAVALKECLKEHA